METELKWGEHPEGGTQAVVLAGNGCFELNVLGVGARQLWNVEWVQDEQARTVAASSFHAADDAVAQAAAEEALRTFLLAALKTLGVDVEAMKARIAAQSIALTCSSEALRRHLDGGHEGDEESGEHYPDCVECQTEAAIAQAEAAETDPGHVVQLAAMQPRWRCFHCDEEFTDREEAAQHFGQPAHGISGTAAGEPACTIDMKKYREMELALARYRSEDTDLHREIHAAHSDKHTAVRRSEEEGYARGLVASPYAAETERARKEGAQEERSKIVALIQGAHALAQHEMEEGHAEGQPDRKLEGRIERDAMDELLGQINALPRGL